jgi:hypothetical protein
VWETLRQFGYTSFGVETGAVCVLHTWGQNLSLHPHIDYADGAKQKPTKLGGVEFLRRFCQHILPHRFVKIRRYGIYSSRVRALKQNENPKMLIKLKRKETVQQRIQRLTGFDVYQCPYCKQGIMHVVEELPRVRSPAGFYKLISSKKL